MLDKKTLIKSASIALPLFVGMTIRLVGIQHGKPDMVYHPDVPKQTLVARHVYHGDLNIRKLFNDDFRRTLYPYGTAVMLGNIAKLGGNKMDKVHRWQWALRMRYLSTGLILISTLVLLVILSRFLKPIHVFLIGTVLLLEPLNTQFSHYGMNDVPLLAFLILGLAFSILMPGEKKIPLWSLLSGLSAGIGFAVKYQGLLGLAFPGMVWLWMFKSRTIKASTISAVTVAAGFLIGLISFSPMLTGDPAYFFSNFGEFMAWQANIMGENRPVLAKLTTNLTAFGGIFMRRGFLLIIPLTLLGAIQTWRSRAKPALAAPSAACLALALLLFAAILGSRDLFRQNDMIPVIAFLLMPAILTISEMGDASRRSAVFLLSVLSAMFLCVSMLDAAALRRVDTRILARDWCDANIPTGKAVAYERYTLPPTREDLILKRCKFIGDKTSRHLILAKEADIFITSSLAHDRFFDQGLPYFNEETQEAYNLIETECSLLKKFSDRQLLYAQPEISVYARRGLQ